MDTEIDGQRNGIERERGGGGGKKGGMGGEGGGGVRGGRGKREKVRGFSLG